MGVRFSRVPSRVRCDAGRSARDAHHWTRLTLRPSSLPPSVYAGFLCFLPFFPPKSRSYFSSYHVRDLDDDACARVPSPRRAPQPATHRQHPRSSARSDARLRRRARSAACMVLCASSAQVQRRTGQSLFARWAGYPETERGEHEATSTTYQGERTMAMMGLGAARPAGQVTAARTAVAVAHARRTSARRSCALGMGPCRRRDVVSARAAVDEVEAKVDDEIEKCEWSASIFALGAAGVG